MSSATDPSPDPPQPGPEDRTVTVAPPAGPTPGRGDDGTATLLPSSQAPGDRPAEPLQIPTPPGYELIGEIGRGGMGVVYKARQRGLNRLVALKVVLAGSHASAGQRMRFLAEAEAVAALNHPGIIGVYEFGSLDGQPYMALEYCPNGTLADRLRGTPLRPRDAATLIHAAARAVAAAHDRGVVHRDIKPANILLTADGTPKIGDFGLAKVADQLGSLTVTGAVMGTPSYMAPEQARGDAKSVGPPADVYALGAVLYECLTGRPPFRGANPADTIVQSLEREPVAVRALNPVVPVDLETVCLKCLEKDPARRYPDATAFADDLTRFLEGRPVVARPVGALGRAHRWVKRNQVVTGLLAAIVVAVAAGTTATYVKYLDEAAQHALAEQQREKAEAETAAKEEALRKLRLTLGELEALTAEQKATLDRLRVEKAATEDALLRGLLRPLRNGPNQTITFEEARVLFEVARMPEERLRFRFVERGLGSAEESEKLTAWEQAVVGAVTGFDRAAALRLRAHVGRVLRDPGAAPECRVACAALVGALPADDAELNLAAARAVVEQLTAERDPVAVEALAEPLKTLAPRLAPAARGSAARAVAGRMARETDQAALRQLGVACELLARRIDPADAIEVGRVLADRLRTEADLPSARSLCDAISAVAGRTDGESVRPLAVALAESLANVVATGKDVSFAYNLADITTLLAGKLPPEEEQAVLRPVLRALVGRFETEVDATVLNNLTTPMSMVARQASPADATDGAKRLLPRLLRETRTPFLSYTGDALGHLAAAMPPDEAEAVGRVLVKRMAGATPSLAYSLSSPVVALARRLPPDAAAAFVRPVALAAADRLVSERDPNVISDLGGVLSNLSAALSPSDAAAVLMVLVERQATEPEPSRLSSLWNPTGRVGERVGPADAAPFVRILAARLVAERDGASANYVSVALRDLIGRLSPADAATVFRPVGLVLTDRLLAERDPNVASNLGAALGNVAPGLDRADAAAAARRLAARVTTESDTSILNQLHSALGVLAARVGGDEEAALVTSVGVVIGRRLATTRDQNQMATLQSCFWSDAPKLSAADARALAPLFIARLTTDRDYSTLSWLSSGFNQFAPRLPPGDAAATARVFAARLADKDSSVLNTACGALAGVAPQLTPEEAAPLARETARRMLAQKDSSNLLYLRTPFTELVRRLPDADLVALLRENVVFHPVRTPILEELGRRSGRTHTPAAMSVAGAAAVLGNPPPAFETYWEFLDWTAKERPDWDVRGTGK